MNIEDLQKEKLLAEIDKIKAETALIQQTAIPKLVVTDDLAREKMQAEIDKLKEETAVIKKPWYSQASFLNLIVSFSVPILTLLGAYYIGGGKEYFDARTLNLQNQRHDLELEVARFSEKKDSLNTRNEALSKNNDSLVSDRTRLLKDTMQLGQMTRSNSEKLVRYEGERKSLSVQVGKLSEQKNSLDRQYRQKNEELLQASFNTYFRKLIGEQNVYEVRVGGSIFSGLQKAIDSGGRFKGQYIDIVRNTIDSTHNIHLKAVLHALMYVCTGDLNWRSRLYADANALCDLILQKKDTEYSRFFFWVIFSDIPWKTPELKRDAVDFLTSCVRKLEAKNRLAVSNILSVVSFFSYYRDFQLYRSTPGDFCKLVQVAYESAQSGTYGIGDGALSFLKTYTPIAYVVTVASLLGNDQVYRSMSPGDRSALIGDAIGYIDKNSDVFTNKPSDLTSSKGWLAWQQQHDDILGIIRDLPLKGCDESTLKKLIGKGINDQ